MREKYFDSYEQEKKYSNKHRRIRNDIIIGFISGIVIIFVIAKKVLENIDAWSNLTSDVKSGNYGFFAILGIWLAVTLIICFLFRKKERSKIKLFRLAGVAAIGIVLIVLFALTVFKAI